jgi:FkbH-like protein
MKLIEALEIVGKKYSADAETLRVSLVCGFTPLHFQTFLAAELRLVLPKQHVKIATGLYGDFWGNLKKTDGSSLDLGIVVMEWSDLDPRLGLRNLGGWAPGDFPDIIANIKLHASQFLTSIDRIAREIPIVVCFPTLPLPPISFSPSGEANTIELELSVCVSQLSLDVSRISNVRVVNAQALDRLSSLSDRFDVKSELISGFPYKLSYSSTLARLVTTLVQSPSPKKGLITDLDDTLWSGILGEVGSAGVSWDLANRSHMHGAYQRLLHALSESGVLIAAASKNEERFVEEALQRPDLVLPRNVLFPIEAHWQPKSESVTRILKTWNIGADATVFIDDSAMELAEVKASHPEVECILFPKNDPQAIYDLLQRLRDLFGKSTISEEDRIRRESIRSSSIHSDANGGYGSVPSDFLAQVEAKVTFTCSKDPLDPRALELVNKTNQFNLNGKRQNEVEWQRYLKGPDTILMITAYQDKYGPLGKIAVLTGRMKDKAFFLDTWVMSCRAFGRHIEYRCIEKLFNLTNASTIIFDFEPTEKNGPLCDFLGELLGVTPTGGCVLSKEQFEKKQAVVFQQVLETSHG